MSVVSDTGPHKPGVDDASVRRVILKLLDYCQKSDWAGYDPYDALNSRVFRATPLFRSKLCRLAFTQLMKRSPINFRPLLGIPKKRNPKGIALFVSALLSLKKAGLFSDDATIHALIDDLIASCSKGQTHACWGYSFDWQTRGDLIPEGSPNIICTTFAGNALLDAWEEYKRQDCLDHAVSASRFLTTELCDDLGPDEVCFNYTPISSSRIHNANLLGAAYMARVGKATGNTDASDLVLRAACYSVHKQAPDGSWPYGEAPTQRWIDNFHTGYNLCALQTIKEQTGSADFDDSIREGSTFYLNHFFLDSGIPKYFHNRTYPIDIHSVAQSLLTLCTFNRNDEFKDRVQTVLRWSVERMLCAEGFFRYRKGRWLTNSIPYIRWSQAWMLLALAHLVAPRKMEH